MLPPKCQSSRERPQNSAQQGSKRPVLTGSAARGDVLVIKQTRSRPAGRPPGSRNARPTSKFMLAERACSGLQRRCLHDGAKTQRRGRRPACSRALGSHSSAGRAVSSSNIPATSAQPGAGLTLPGDTANVPRLTSIKCNPRRLSWMRVDGG